MRINDVVGLFMPYNLKDSNVTLDYIAKNTPKIPHPPVYFQLQTPLFKSNKEYHVQINLHNIFTHSYRFNGL